LPIESGWDDYLEQIQVQGAPSVVTLKVSKECDWLNITKAASFQGNYTFDKLHQPLLEYP
jgi:hypothetical protein